MTARSARLAGLPPIEVALAIAVIVGAGVALVTPANVARIVTLAGPAATHPTPVVVGLLIGWAAMVLVVARFWGPVRVDAATERWLLRAESDRTPVLRRAVLRAVAGITVAHAAAAGVLILVAPGLAAPLALTAACSIAAVATLAYLAQCAADARALPFPPGPTERRWFRLRALNTLHRRTIAPTDGAASAVRLTLTMMDTTWLTETRTARWQQRHRRASTRSAPPTTTSLAAFEIRRLARHPGSLVRWALPTLVSVVLALVTTVHVGAALPVAVLAYGAGSSLTGGLRQIVEKPALRRALGARDRDLIARHAVVPAVGAIACCVLTAPFWHLGPAAITVVAAGTAIAVVRRATRPPPAYDSVLVFDPVTGAPFQPLVLLNLIRGPVAVIGTAIVAGLL